MKTKTRSQLLYRRGLWLILALFLSWGAAACSCGTPPGQLPDGVVSEGVGTDASLKDAPDVPPIDTNRCPQENTICNTDSDCQKCGAKLVCLAGAAVCAKLNTEPPPAEDGGPPPDKCQKTCNSNVDCGGCGPDFVCLDGRCANNTPPDRKCPERGDPCRDSSDCRICGQQYSCVRGTCSDAVPDVQPDVKQCPNNCSNNSECNIPECGARSQCVNGVCSWPPRVCPNSCANDSACQTPVCGRRIRCVQGKCSDLPACPARCGDDSDCKLLTCGPKQACIGGQCSEPPQNQPPVADAGPDQRVQAGKRVQLDGRKSRDADKDPLTYRWSFVKKPVGSLATLDNPQLATPAFVADRAAEYQLQLIVNDGKVDSKPSLVTIRATAQPPAPAPVLASLSPAKVQEGQAIGTVKIFGRFFLKGATVTFAGLNLTANYVNSTEISIFLVSGLKAGKYTVQVTNIDKQKSNVLTFEVVAAPKLAPKLVRLDPVEVKERQAFTLNAYGENFQKGARLVVSGTPQATNFVSDKQLQLKSLGLPAGFYTVLVLNPDGKSSARLVFQVKKVLQGPILTSLSPTTAFVGAGFILILKGDRFVKGATIQFASATVKSIFVSSKELRAILSWGSAGNFTVEVTNPDKQKSNALRIEVKKRLSKPTLTGLKPASVQEGRAVTLEVRGTGFVKGAQATVGGKSYPTSFVSATEVRVTLPTTLKPGTLPVQVTNPDKQKTNSLNLTITPKPPAPEISSIAPLRVPYLSATSITVTGKNFVKGAQVQVDAGLQPTVFVSATSLRFTTPNRLAVGKHTVRVFNPDSQVSNSVTFEVFRAPAPVLSSLGPNSGTSGSVVNIKLTGKNFTKGATGIFQGGAQNTSFSSATELGLTLSLASLSAGKYEIWVRNPDGQVSNKLSFEVKAPQGPQITKLLPNKGTLNAKVNGLIDGSGFVKGAKVTLGTKSYTTTLLNTNTLGVVWDLTGIKAGTYPVQVVNPNGVKSNVVYFTIAAKKLPAPVLTSVTPSTIVFSKNAPLYLLGKNFQNGALLMLPIPFAGTIGLPCNFINANTLVVTTQFPRIPIPFPAQNVQVFVKNPDNQTSNRKSVRITR